jgi:hypothetical protein
MKKVGVTGFEPATSSDGSLSVHVFDSNYQYKFSIRELN